MTKEPETMTAVEILAELRKLPAEEHEREAVDAVWVVINGNRCFMTPRDRLRRRADQLIKEAGL